MPVAEEIAHDPHAPVDPRVETLVNELIGRVADKWTLLVLEELEDHGTCRFTELARRVPGISQAETWLEVVADDIAAASRHFEAARVVRCDEI